MSKGPFQRQLFCSEKGTKEPIQGGCSQGLAEPMQRRVLLQVWLWLISFNLLTSLVWNDLIFLNILMIYCKSGLFIRNLPGGTAELCNCFPRGQWSIRTPLPPIQGRNQKIKPHLAVYSTKINLTQGSAKILQCQRQGGEKPGGKWGKRFVKCGQAGEENSSPGVSFLPPQTLFMKSELLHPQHMEPRSRTDGKWENFKPFPDFSSVFSPFTSWAPDWTGANNISCTLCPHSPTRVPWSSEGLQAGRDLQRSSS